MSPGIFNFEITYSNVWWAVLSFLFNKYVGDNLNKVSYQTKKEKTDPYSRYEMLTGVIFSNCFFFGLRTSSGFPSILDERNICEIHLSAWEHCIQYQTSYANRSIYKPQYVAVIKLAYIFLDVNFHNYFNKFQGIVSNNMHIFIALAVFEILTQKMKHALQV